MATTSTKICRKCRRELPVTEFWANPKCRDGRSSWCKDCARAAVRESRAVHGEKYNARRRGTVAVRDGPRRAIEREPDCAAYLATVACDPCAYCGEPASDLDHIDPVGLGGADEWANFTASCRRCNQGKREFPLLTFLLRGPRPQDRAAAFLERELGAGPVPKRVLFGRAIAAGLTEATVRRAAEQLGVQHLPDAGDRRTRVWALPA